MFRLDVESNLTALYYVRGRTVESHMSKMAERAMSEPSRHSRIPRLLSALFYGSTSFALVMVNKSILTKYR